MPTIHTYLVSFSPAERTSHGFTAEIGLMAYNLKNAKEVQATNLKDLERSVRELAHEYGQTCAPMVRLKDRKARKPAGFEAWCSTIQIIDYVAPVVTGKQASVLIFDDIHDSKVPA